MIKSIHYAKIVVRRKY